MRQTWQISGQRVNGTFKLIANGEQLHKSSAVNAQSCWHQLKADLLKPKCTLVVNVPSGGPANADQSSKEMLALAKEIARDPDVQEKGAIARIALSGGNGDAVEVRREDGRPIRVLLIFADPQSNSFWARQEREELRRLFYTQILASLNVKFDILFHDAILSRIREVGTAGTNDTYDIVHWSGPFIGGKLVVRDNDDASRDKKLDESRDHMARKEISGTELAALFRNSGEVPSLFFLSTYPRDDSALNADSVPQIAFDLLREGISQVVSVSHSRTNQLWLPLVRSFYEGIFGDEHPLVEAALFSAQHQVGRDAAAPLLFGDRALTLLPPTGKSDQLRLRLPKPTQLLEQSKSLDPPDGFAERDAELTQLFFSWLRDGGRRVAVIRAPKKHQKTSLAAEVIHMWHAGAAGIHPFDFVLAVDMRAEGSSWSVTDFAQGLKHRLDSVQSPALDDLRAALANNKFDAAQAATTLQTALLVERILLVILNLDEILASNDSGFKDRRWTAVLNALADLGRDAFSRVLITSRSPIPGLDSDRVLVVDLQKASAASGSIATALTVSSKVDAVRESENADSPHVHDAAAYEPGAPPTNASILRTATQEALLLSFRVFQGSQPVGLRQLAELGRTIKNRLEQMKIVPAGSLSVSVIDGAGVLVVSGVAKEQALAVANQIERLFESEGDEKLSAAIGAHFADVEFRRDPNGILEPSGRSTHDVAALTRDGFRYAGRGMIISGVLRDSFTDRANQEGDARGGTNNRFEEIRSVLLREHHDLGSKRDDGHYLRRYLDRRWLGSGDSNQTKFPLRNEIYLLHHSKERTIAEKLERKIKEVEQEIKREPGHEVEALEVHLIDERWKDAKIEGDVVVTLVTQDALATFGAQLGRVRTSQNESPHHLVIICEDCEWQKNLTLNDRPAYPLSKPPDNDEYSKIADEVVSWLLPPKKSTKSIEEQRGKQPDPNQPLNFLATPKDLPAGRWEAGYVAALVLSKDANDEARKRFHGATATLYRIIGICRKMRGEAAQPYLTKAVGELSMYRRGEGLTLFAPTGQPGAVDSLEALLGVLGFLRKEGGEFSAVVRRGDCMGWVTPFLRRDILGDAIISASRLVETLPKDHLEIQDWTDPVLADAWARVQESDSGRSGSNHSGPSSNSGNEGGAEVDLKSLCRSNAAVTIAKFKHETPLVEFETKFEKPLPMFVILIEHAQRDSSREWFEDQYEESCAVLREHLPALSSPHSDDESAATTDTTSRILFESTGAGFLIACHVAPPARLKDWLVTVLFEMAAKKLNMRAAITHGKITVYRAPIVNEWSTFPLFWGSPVDLARTGVLEASAGTVRWQKVAPVEELFGRLPLLPEAPAGWGAVSVEKVLDDSRTEPYRKLPRCWLLWSNEKGQSKFLGRDLDVAISTLLKNIQREGLGLTISESLASLVLVGLAIQMGFGFVDAHIPDKVVRATVPGVLGLSLVFGSFSAAAVCGYATSRVLPLLDRPELLPSKQDELLRAAIRIREASFKSTCPKFREIAKEMGWARAVFWWRRNFDSRPTATGLSWILIAVGILAYGIAAGIAATWLKVVVTGVAEIPVWIIVGATVALGIFWNVGHVVRIRQVALIFPAKPLREDAEEFNRHLKSTFTWAFASRVWARAYWAAACILCAQGAYAHAKGQLSNALLVAWLVGLLALLIAHRIVSTSRASILERLKRWATEPNRFSNSAVAQEEPESANVDWSGRPDDRTSAIADSAIQLNPYAAAANMLKLRGSLVRESLGVVRRILQSPRVEINDGCNYQFRGSSLTTEEREEAGFIVTDMFGTILYRDAECLGYPWKPAEKIYESERMEHHFVDPVAADLARQWTRFTGLDQTSEFVVDLRKKGNDVLACRLLVARLNAGGGFPGYLAIIVPLAMRKVPTIEPKSPEDESLEEKRSVANAPPHKDRVVPTDRVVPPNKQQGPKPQQASEFVWAFVKNYGDWSALVLLIFWLAMFGPSSAPQRTSGEGGGGSKVAPTSQPDGGGVAPTPSEPNSSSEPVASSKPIASAPTTKTAAPTATAPGPAPTATNTASQSSSETGTADPSCSGDGDTTVTLKDGSCAKGNVVVVNYDQLTYLHTFLKEVPGGPRVFLNGRCLATLRANQSRNASFRAVETGDKVDCKLQSASRRQ